MKESKRKSRPQVPGFRQFALLAAAFLFGSFCIGAGASAADEPVVLAGAEYGYPPFSIVDEEGRPTGFSVELMRAALAAMGRRVVFRTGTWPEARSWLARGEVQTLPLVGRTPEREDLFDFTFPYISLHGAIVVRTGTAGIQTLADLSGRQVAVMQGDNAEEFLRRQKLSLQIHATATFEEALRGLSEGRHDAVLVQRLVALRLIRKYGFSNLTVVDRPVKGFRQDFCFAVKDGDRETLALLNEGLSLVMADGTFRHLHAKWFAALQLPVNRRIVIGGDENYPPFEYLNENGQPAGFNVEITRAVADAVGLDVEIRLGPWAEIREAAAQGEIDAVQGMLYSPERDLALDFTQPYTVNHYVGVVRKGSSPPPAGAEELAGLRIVVQRGDIMHDFVVEQHLQGQTTLVENQEDALRAVAEGRRHCALVARLTALYWIEHGGWENLAIGSRALLSPGYSFAVQHNQQALLAQLSEGLKIIDETGEYRRIREEYLGVYEDLPPRFSEALRYIALVAVPLLLLALGFFVWSRSLRRQVATRTEELAESEIQYRLLADNMLDVIWTMAPDLVFTYVNPSIGRLTGHTPEEVIGTHLRQHCDDANFAKMAGVVDREIEKGADHQGGVLEAEFLRKDGSSVPVEIHASLIFDGDMNPVRVQGVTRDISERKRSERELKERNDFIQTILDNLPIGLAVHYIDEGRATYVNRRFEEIYGWPKEEILEVEQFFEKVYPDPAYRREIKRRVIEDIRSGDPEKMVWDGVEATGKNGRKKIVSAKNIPLHRQNLMISTVQDITESTKLQGRLQQAQKLEAIGTLAGGIAHDFNNILALILGYTELALEDAEKNSSLSQYLAEILVAGKRAKDLVRQILTFARKSDEERKPIRVDLIAKEALKFFRSSLPSTIDIRQHIETDSPIMGDPTKIHQIFMNLCTNAAQAMEDEGGVLQVRMKDVTVSDPSKVQKPALAAGPYIELTVSDSGVGIPADSIDSIFDPYFTTKAPGEGTGLGLAVVHGIVESHGGKISVESEPGKGTVFTVWLPTHRRGQERDAGEKEALPSGSERILFVDDEVPVAEIGGRLLQRLGYRVETMTSSLAALERFRSQPEDFDLVITDMTMPDMTGDRLAAEMISLRPDIPIAVCTGYSRKISESRAAEIGIRAFAYKPIVKKDLARTVRRVLDGESLLFPEKL